MNSRLTHPDIIALYGQELESAGKPYQPFKVKTWHVVGGIVILGLAGYGVYALVNNITDSLKDRQNFQFKPKKDSSNKN